MQQRSVVGIRLCENALPTDIILATGSLTNLLQKAAVSIIDQADCQQSYGNVLTPNMMCAGHMEGGRDTCMVSNLPQSFPKAF